MPSHPIISLASNIDLSRQPIFTSRQTVSNSSPAQSPRSPFLSPSFPPAFLPTRPLSIQKPGSPSRTIPVLTSLALSIFHISASKVKGRSQADRHQTWSTALAFSLLPLPFWSLCQSFHHQARHPSQTSSGIQPVFESPLASSSLPHLTATSIPSPVHL
ncbi:hypothetical protein IE53DRAFT_5510 [Violaceomyces palustris]|uniref:Uncharacterized protein n=1 Tax=Violaceomyces palustris TaxID=1673888 RepID=A0ACD0NLU8_9BASI|nr:hypothetical protein IE53DRAFT_5510 [Violaceomyces palustris]